MSPEKTFRFAVKSSPKELTGLRGRLKNLLGKLGVSPPLQDSIVIAVGEACTNAYRHAYNQREDRVIRLTVREEPGKIFFSIRDYGKKFDPGTLKTPELPPKKSGGLGIYFMRTIMDEVRYNTSHKRGNELVLIKNRSEKP